MSAKKLKIVELTDTETGKRFFYRTISAMLADKENDINITDRGWRMVAKKQRTKMKKYEKYSVVIKSMVVSSCVVENTKEGQKISLIWFASDM